MGTVDSHTHLLHELRLPSRYESLVAMVGEDVARLLVEPADETLEVFRQVALHVRARGRGLFLPLYAPSGTGKTTLVSNLATWLPKEFAGTARLAGGEVTTDRLVQATAALSQEQRLPANESRIVVVNVDDRESDPPSDKEISQIKSFLRQAGAGSRTVVVWPETSKKNADAMAADFEMRAGKSPIPLPVHIVGPVRQEWPGLAVETLKLANRLAKLEQIGVDPRTYDPNADPTLGDFLDRISEDFVALLADLLRSTRKPVRVVIAFVSESGNAGVLGELTGGARYGLLDADRLVSATPKSVIGRWWAGRAGLLVQTIVRLEARAVFITPSLAVPIVRRFGPEAAAEALDALGFKPKPPSEISTYFDRSEFGRLLKGEDSPTAEIRGNPAHDARAGYALLAQEYGLGSGNDKKLNRALADFLQVAQADLGVPVSERRLPHIPLIPDLALDADDETTCIELHWRSGDFLTTTNRSEIAQYILKKLKAYAVEFGWASD